MTHVPSPPPAPDLPWFNPIAAFLGPAYLRNACTKGTLQDVDFQVDAIGLAPSMRVLDVGCGPGRHALELARRKSRSTVSTLARSPDHRAQIELIR